MNNKYITTIGEALIDWVCLDKTLDLYEATQFIKAPGGAPANVSVGLAKLNYPVQFVGGFSKDLFGRWLREYLKSYNVNLSHSIDIKDSNTRCAYILTDKNNNRVLKGFSMHSCADSMINIEDINLNAISNSPLVYFGSLLQTNESSRFTLSNILNTITSNSITVYDPNLRLCMWPNLEVAVKTIIETFNIADVVKLSDDEIELITNTSDIELAAKTIYNDYKLKLLVVTMGSKGSYYINKRGNGLVKPFKVESIEETGAGDGFVAGILGGIYDLLLKEPFNNCILEETIENLTPEIIEKIMLKANAIGAITTTKPGATSALPTKEELEVFLKSKI